jgi:hypothetical protein
LRVAASTRPKPANASQASPPRGRVAKLNAHDDESLLAGVAFAMHTPVLSPAALPTARSHCVPLAHCVWSVQNAAQ